MKKARVFGTDYAALKKALLQIRSNKRVIMASGTFDLFHIGHMRMLEAAKQQGDILIVAVKSDRAAALKKEDPPVLNQQIRMEAISNSVWADYVVLADYDPRRQVSFDFANEAAYQWLNIFAPVVSEIKPDVFVHEDNPMLREARKELFTQFNVTGYIQPRTEGISTTEIIDKIKTRLLMQLNK